MEGSEIKLATTSAILMLQFVAASWHCALLFTPFPLFICHMKCIIQLVSRSRSHHLIWEIRAVTPRKESEHLSCTGRHSTFSLFHCQMQDFLTTEDSRKMTKTLRRLDYQPPRDMCPYLVGSYLPPWSHPAVEYKFSAQWCWHFFVEFGSPLCQLVH